MGGQENLARRDFFKLALGSAAALPTLTYSGFESKRPNPVLGVYYPFDKLIDADKLEPFKDLVLESGANTVVMDIKSEAGKVHVPVDHPLSPDFRAYPESPEALSDFLDWTNRNDLYVIGRQVVMKDQKFVNTHPNFGLKSSKGGIWHDVNNYIWTNPFRPEVAEYNAAVAQAAINFGISEIQYDYIRFPSDDSDTQSVIFTRQNSQKNRVNAITNILQKGREYVNEAGGRLSADFFGWAIWEQVGDLGIGQDTGESAHHLDGLSPMAYPSLYNSGVPEGENGELLYEPGIDHMYETLYYTTLRAVERMTAVNENATVVPWFQIRDDGRGRKKLTLEDYVIQQKGALDAGAHGVLAWDPTLRYHPNLYTHHTNKEQNFLQRKLESIIY